jgi:hypothetical protein
MVERDIPKESDKLLPIVREELVEAQEFINRLEGPTPNRHLVNIIVICLILVSTLLMLIFEKFVLLWFIVAFLLYSYNFVVWFLPTTKIKNVWPKRERLELKGMDFKGPIRFLLKKRKMFGIEVVITIFLAGMVSLGASFFLLFCLGLPFVFFYGFAPGHIYPWNVFSLVTQVCVILAFFGLLLLIKPETRGFSRLSHFLKGKVGRAHLRGMEAFVISVAFVATAMALMGALFVGAMLLPGGTTNELVGFLGNDGGLNLILLMLIFLAEFVIMRHLQSLSSRKMARELLIGRIASLKEVEASLASPGLEIESFEMAARLFFGLVLLKVQEYNFLGRWPVYVIRPEVRYLLDEGALAYMD